MILITVSNVKIPKLDLAKFDEHVRNWSNFISLYNVLIHDNSDLTNTEKFEYLMTVLGPDFPVSTSTSIHVIPATRYSIEAFCHHSLDQLGGYSGTFPESIIKCQ